MVSFPHRIRPLALINPKLIPNVDLWHLDLEHITSQEQDNALVHLASHELERAYSYRRKQDQRHFIIRRMLLKKILAFYGHMVPIDIQLRDNQQKKPMIANRPDLQFNTTHTYTRGVVAVHPWHSVGIDIEEMGVVEDCASLLDQFASIEEKRWVNTSMHHFFMLWTIKEALLKCQGTGFLVETLPDLDHIPDCLEENLYVSRSQGYIIYSTLWEKSWVSICRPDYYCIPIKMLE